MKFSVDSDDLRSATAHLRSIVTRGHPTPILSNIRIEAQEDKVQLRSTDLQLEMNFTLDSNTSEVGATTVSANILGDIAQRLPPKIPVEFTFQEDESKINIVAGATDCDLVTLSDKDFPEMASSENEITFNVESKVLFRLFDMTKHSVGAESARKYLQGVFLHHIETDKGNFLRCVSSDGYRLTQVDSPAPPKSDKFPPMIIPHKAVLEVIKLIKIAPQKIEISASEKKVRFSTPTMTFSSRLINSDFPTYNHLIPDPAGIRMVVDAESCLNALSRLSPVVISHNESAVAIVVSDDNLHMTVNARNLGTIQENLQVAFSSDETKIKFRHSHMLGVFTQLNEGKVSVEFQKTPNATRFTLDSDENALFILMPIRG